MTTSIAAYSYSHIGTYYGGHGSHGIVDLIIDAVVRSAVYRMVGSVMGGHNLPVTLALGAGLILVAVGLRHLLR